MSLFEKKVFFLIGKVFFLVGKVFLLTGKVFLLVGKVFFSDRKKTFLAGCKTFPIGKKTFLARKIYFLVKENLYLVIVAGNFLIKDVFLTVMLKIKRVAEALSRLLFIFDENEKRFHLKFILFIAGKLIIRLFNRFSHLAKESRQIVGLIMRV